jgi:hypothetical protein
VEAMVDRSSPASAAGSTADMTVASAPCALPRER